MPLDSHSFLVAQGWSGKGTGLREGAISRPVTVSQKKTLAGVGKDRDEAFPFWDHLFSAAAKSIQVKISSDSDDDEDSDSSTKAAPTLKRTTTGILSNRRPAEGVSVNTSGDSTPESEAPRLNLIAMAKREAARKGLYSRFFRGPVIGPADAFPPEPATAIQVEIVHAEGEVEDKEKSTTSVEGGEPKEDRRERKRLKTEMKAREKSEKEQRRQKKRLRKEAKEKGKQKDCREKSSKKRKREDEKDGEEDDNEAKPERKTETERLKSREEKAARQQLEVRERDKCNDKQKKKRRKTEEEDAPLPIEQKKCKRRNHD